MLRMRRPHLSAVFVSWRAEYEAAVRAALDNALDSEHAHRQDLEKQLREVEQTYEEKLRQAETERAELLRRRQRAGLRPLLPRQPSLIR